MQLGSRGCAFRRTWSLGGRLRALATSRYLPYLIMGTSPRTLSYSPLRNDVSCYFSESTKGTSKLRLYEGSKGSLTLNPKP